MTKFIISIQLVLTFTICSAQDVMQIGDYISDENADQIDIAMQGEVPYVAYTEGIGRVLKVKKYNGTDWELLGNMPPINTGDIIDFEFDNNIPYVLFSDGLGLTLVKYEKEEWFIVGKKAFAGDPAKYSTYNEELLFVDGKPHVIYRNAVTRKIDAHVLETKGNLRIWSDMPILTEIPENAENPHLCVNDDGNIIIGYAVRKKNSISILQVDPSGEKLVKKGASFKGATNFIDMEMIENHVHIMFEDPQDSYMTSIMQLNAKNKFEILPGSPQVKGTQVDLLSNMAVVWKNAHGGASIVMENNGDWTIISLTNSNTGHVCAATGGSKTYVAYTDKSNGKRLVVKEVKP